MTQYADGSLSTVPMRTMGEPVGGTDGRYIRTLLTDANGQLYTLATVNGSVTVSGAVNASLVPATTGGNLSAGVLTAAGTNATVAKAAPGQLYGYDFYNNAAYAVFVHFYNLATAPIVGTSVPVFTIGFAATSGRSVALQFGAAFSAGIAYSVTKSPAATDATAVAANDLTGVLIYE